MLIIYFHSTGYFLFQIKKFDHIGNQINATKAALQNIKNFSSDVRLRKKYIFPNVDEAKYSDNSIKNNQIPRNLLNFLNKCSLKSIHRIGVPTPSIVKELRDTFGCNFECNENSNEVIRSIRFHIDNLIKKYENNVTGKALTLKSFDVPKNNSINVTRTYKLIQNIEKSIAKNQCKLKHIVINQIIWKIPNVAHNALLENNHNINMLCKVLIEKQCNSDIESEDLKEMFNYIIEKNIYIGDIFEQTITVIIKDIEALKTTYSSLVSNVCELTKYVAPNLTSFIENCQHDKRLFTTELLSSAGSLKKLVECPSSTLHTLAGHIYSKSECMGDIAKNDINKIRSVELKLLCDKASLAARVDHLSKDNGDCEYGMDLSDKFKRQLKSKLQKINSKSLDMASIENFKQKRKAKKIKWIKRKYANKQSAQNENMEI